MFTRYAILACAALTTTTHALDLGNLVFVGDSITQGGPANSSSYKAASYRYELWKHLVDNGTTYDFVGSQSGGYTGGGTTAVLSGYKGQTFENTHEGHYGWRAFWENGTQALPGGRYNTGNLGQGTIANWTGQSTTFNTGNAGTLNYTGSTYTPDTVVIMIGINDLGTTTPATTMNDIQLMVQQYQAANANVRVFVSSILPVSANHGSAGILNPKVTTINQSLATTASAWSTGTSTVSFIDVRDGFDATKMTYDNTHPNYAGERVIARNFATALGIGARDNTLGLSLKSGSALATTNDMHSLPGTTAGPAFYRAGTIANWSDPTANDSMITLTSSTGASSYLQSDWNIASNASYSLETRLQMVINGSSDNNLVLWTDDGAGGAAAGFLRIFTDRTEWGFASGSTRLALDFSDNTDTQHTFRLTFDGTTYAVWRDGILIADGLSGDASVSASNRAIIGDFSSTGISTSAIIDFVGYETGTAFAPVPEPSIALLGGLGTLLLLRRRR